MSLVRTAVLATAATFAAGSPASADVELGGTAGLHVFSTNNELGVRDHDSAASERNAALFGLRIGVSFTDVVGVEGEFAVVPSAARMPEFGILNVTYRAHLIAQLGAANSRRKLVPFLVGGGGAMTIVNSKDQTVIDKDTDAALYLGIGAKYRINPGWGVRADARVLFPPSSASNGPTVDFEALVSVYKAFGGTEPQPKVVDVPKEPRDTDGDGLTDEVDKCPTDAEDKDGFQDDDGCPDTDNDGDGVLDANDKCPSDAEDKDGFADDDGCPDADNDADGMPDATDKCPNEAEDKDGFQDDDGCPDTDNDSDGVPDANDKCPTEAETKNGFQDDDGCPDQIPAKVKKFTGVVQGINFRTGSSELLNTSFRTLDQAVAVLKEFPDLKMEIQGHTDDVTLKPKKGSQFADNLELSQARAESVREYFIKKGVTEDRLSAKGYGDTAPVVDPAGLKGGKLKTARAKNRRVEFQLVQAPSAP